jgi:4-oxalocrotonate tautomerase
MPVIRVEMFPGRTVQQKGDLVRELTEGFLRSCGGKPEQVHIIITEVEKCHWGSGGRLVTDKEAKGS